MDPAPERRNREPWIFLAACLVCGLAFQGARGLFETDEGRYAQCAREMAASGDWLLPTLQGVPHLTKPPGAYWLIAAGLEVLGRNEWGARIALGLAFGASAWCVRVIARVLSGDAAGARAGWIYLSMAFPFAAGSVLTTDTFLAAFTLGSLACVVLSTTSARPWALLGAAGLLLGGAVLVKGHTPFVPWIACTLALAAGRRAPGGRWWLGVAASALVGTLGFWWYLHAADIVPGASEQFGREVTSRLTGTGDHDALPLWYYPGLLIAGAMPWWVPLVRGVRRAHGTDVGRTLLVWAGVTFLVFEVVPAKMPLYVLPVAAPLALWAALGTRHPESPWPARPWLLGAWLAFLCGLRVVPTLLYDDPRDMRALAAAVARADPSGTARVAVYMGEDVNGLDFYFERRPLRLRSRHVPTHNAKIAVRRAAAVFAAKEKTWLLVVEDEPETDARVAGIAGDTAHLAERTPGYRIYRIVPAPR